MDVVFPIRQPCDINRLLLILQLAWNTFYYAMLSNHEVCFIQIKIQFVFLDKVHYVFRMSLCKFGKSWWKLVECILFRNDVLDWNNYVTIFNQVTCVYVCMRACACVYVTYYVHYLQIILWLYFFLSGRSQTLCH